MSIKNKILIGAFIAILIAFLIYQNKYYRKEISRVKSNYIAVIEETGRQQDIKMKEYKKFYEYKYDSLTSLLNIKRKNIQTITKIKYNIKDSIVRKYETQIEYVKAQEIEKFDIYEPCYAIAGNYFEGYITIDYLEYNDEVTSFTYRDFDKKFLGFKWKPYYTTKIYSNCKKDTVAVEENIKIIKDKRFTLFKRNK